MPRGHPPKNEHNEQVSENKSHSLAVPNIQEKIPSWDEVISQIQQFSGTNPLITENWLDLVENNILPQPRGEVSAVVKC